MSESQLQAAILTVLRANGAHVERNAQLRRGRIKGGMSKGSADIIAVYRGKAIAIECKGTHRVTCACVSCEDQRQWALSWLRAGGLYRVARTVEQALQILKEVAA